MGPTKVLSLSCVRPLAGGALISKEGPAASLLGALVSNRKAPSSSMVSMVSWDVRGLADHDRGTMIVLGAPGAPISTGAEGRSLMGPTVHAVDIRSHICTSLHIYIYCLYIWKTRTSFVYTHVCNGVCW